MSVTHLYSRGPSPGKKLTEIFDGKTLKEAAHNAALLAWLCRQIESHLLPDEDGHCRETIEFFDPELGRMEPVPIAAIERNLRELKAVEARERAKAENFLRQSGS